MVVAAGWSGRGVSRVLSWTMAILVAVGFVAVAHAADPAATGGEATGEVELCHKPATEAATATTVRVSLSAVLGHLAHGDARGPCDVDTVAAGDLAATTDNCGRQHDVCDPNADCVKLPKPQGRACRCKAGFEGDGLTCSDRDECRDGSAECGENAACVNAQGRYYCQCEAGYAGEGRDCVDVDECAAGVADCDVNASCHNVPGGFACACNRGYEGGGRECHDRDECGETPEICGARATCRNTEGGYQCSCDPGYESAGPDSCRDIDECELDENRCEPNAICVNTDGGHFCSCTPGFEWDGLECSDVDECASGVNACHRHADCTNTDGSYACKCADGYAGDGRERCVHVDGDCGGCPAGELCYPNGKCGAPGAPCVSSTECGGDEICYQSVGLCAAPGAPCLDEVDCGDGEVCFEHDGWCGRLGDPCEGDPDCADVAATEGYLCHGDSGTCQPPADECTSNADCGDPCRLDQECRGGECVGVPLCHPECGMCAGGLCGSMCGNPYEPYSSDITVGDSLLTLRASVELERCPLCVCDVNDDGAVTVTDSLSLLRHVVELPERLRCPDPAAAFAVGYHAPATFTSTTSTVPLSLLE